MFLTDEEAEGLQQENLMMLQMVWLIVKAAGGKVVVPFDLMYAMGGNSGYLEKVVRPDGGIEWRASDGRDPVYPASGREVN